MNRLTRIKLFEAEQYVEDALGRADQDDEYSPTVAIGHATDALILALDALCHSREVQPAKRHDAAVGLFLDLIRTQRIPEEASHWREFLTRAHQQRAAFQYGGELASRTDARRFAQKAQSFVGWVRQQVADAD